MCSSPFSHFKPSLTLYLWLKRVSRVHLAPKTVAQSHLSCFAQ